VTGLSRRALIGRGLVGAGTLALPGSLVAAATAQAQEDAQTDALQRVVVLEQALELAYSVASEDGKLDDGAKKLFDDLSVHSGDHATAFAEAMDQLAVDPPESSSDPGDYPSLEDFDAEAPQRDILSFFIDRETELIQAYEEDEPDLDEPDLIRTSAQIAASHAQGLVALRLLAKAKGNPAELPEPQASASGG
jgi:rubrerythrin